MLVLAGPGAGKTAVITRRVLWLVGEAGVDPAGILVVTFTRAAADEMRQRFFSMAGEKTPVSFGTFHSVFFSILKYACGYTASSIIREEQKLEFMDSIIRDMKIDTDNVKEFSADILSEISSVKGNMIDISHYYSPLCAEEVFREIFVRYGRMMKDRGLIDFDDMMLDTRELFVRRRDILAAWQNKFRYILVDEFQDISPLQYELVRMLAAPQDNLFVVGDDDQSIYGFRGARPRIMLNFEQDYRGAGRILLPVNYRSQSAIVRGAGKVIRHNSSRFEKNIRASRPCGNPIDIRVFQNISDETAAVLDRIRELRGRGLPYSETAVLFRTNSQARPCIERLLEYNIPFTVQDAVPDLYRHWISEDMLAYLRIAHGSRARGDFLRIINRPNRYVSRSVFVNAKVDPASLRGIYRGKPWMQRRLDRLSYDLNAIKYMQPREAIDYIRRDVGYDEFLDEYARTRGFDGSGLFQILDELSESAARHTDCEEWFEYITDFSASLREKNLQKDKSTGDCVPLATMHHSKGLEYTAVIIVDANEGVMPYHKAASEEDIEEERRMFYVAMTRARDELSIFLTKERHGRPLRPSRFVNEILDG